MKPAVSAALALALSTLVPAAPASAGDQPFLGDIMIVGFNFCPRGWAAANGQLLPINQNQALYSILGTQFGGDGRTTFALPDLRGRAPIGEGQGPGLPAYAIGQKVGAETTTLNQTTLASHSHAIVGLPTAELKATSSTPTTNDPAGNIIPTFPAGSNVYASAQGTPEPMHDGTVDLTIRVSIGNTGGGQSMNNMQPYLVLNHCIALQGTFPSRN